MKRSITRHTARTFWQHAKRYPWLLASLIGFTSIAVIADSFFTYAGKLIVAGMIANNFAEIMTAFWILIGVTIINFAAWRAAEFTTCFFQPAVMADLGKSVFQHVHKLDYDFFTNNFAGSLVKKINRFAGSFEQIADEIQFQILKMVVNLIVTITFFVIFFPFFLLYFFIWLVLFVVGSVTMNILFYKYEVAAATADSQWSGTAADSISNAQTVKEFAKLAWEMQIFSAINQKWRRLTTKSWTMSQYNDIYQGTTINIFFILVTWLAIGRWQSGSMSIDDFVFLQGLLLVTFGYLWTLGRVVRNLFRAFANAEEAAEILLLSPNIIEKADAKDLIVKRGCIEFADVAFTYENNLRAVDLTTVFKPQCVTALVGPSGGGKSTLVKLLVRFIDPQQGQITIDGQNITEVTMQSLREQISVVPQDPLLFHRSLRDNIAYGRPEASEQDIMAAAEAAYAHDFVSNLPDGYDTLVGERGIKLSGGQRQRIALARAFLKNAPILVLDEATSALDSESEALIQKALINLQKGKTTIIIAHRLSTIKHADQIVVLDQGRVIESGSHTQLLQESSGLYKRLFELQTQGYVS